MLQLNSVYIYYNIAGMLNRPKAYLCQNPNHGAVSDKLAVCIRDGFLLHISSIVLLQLVPEISSQGAVAT